MTGQLLSKRTMPEVRNETAIKLGQSHFSVQILDTDKMEFVRKFHTFHVPESQSYSIFQNYHVNIF